MKQRMMEFFQVMSRAFLLPISFISCGGILMGVTSLLNMPEIVAAMPVLHHPSVQYLNGLIGNAAGFMFDNLGLLMAISLTFFLARHEQSYAGFNAVVSYFVFNISMGCMVRLPEIATLFPVNALGEVLGYHTLKTGVLGGVVVGLLAAAVHNRTYNTRLPVAFGFFAGVRFVPIACTLFFAAFGQLFVFIWIPVSNAINAIANAISQTGVFAPFVYAFGERLLIPTGLHHIWNAAIRNTEVSGVALINGEYVAGVLNIYNKYLQTGVVPEGMTLTDICRFLRGGQMPITMFALPAIGLAMYHAAHPSQRERVKSLYISGICTSFIAGITEPLEFAFLFVAPLLYVVYALLNGLSFMLAYLLHTAVGGTEADIIGMVLFGILRPDTRWYYLVAIGLAMGVVCYYGFKAAIIRFDIKTPGRTVTEYDLADAGEIDEELRRDPLKLKAALIIRALGGSANIVQVDCCVSRLRVRVNDSSLTDRELINSTGCSGLVIIDQHHLQIVYGATVNMIRDAVNRRLDRERKEQ
ncbi:MAG: PTS transporter subunit EIIC [Negativicutes bacterium]|nr:PTS transporter subunit EIIC [Negativicutes bacterium]